MGVLLFSNSIYSAFSLVLVLVSISLFYILANAAQLLIYGSYKCFNHICCDVLRYKCLFVVMFMKGSAINVLIIFVVMEYSKDLNLWTTSIFVSLMTTIVDTSWYGIIWTTRSNQILEPDLISNSQQIGMVGPYGEGPSQTGTAHPPLQAHLCINFFTLSSRWNQWTTQAG